MKFNKPIEEIKNDYHLFIDIQTGKYLKSANQSEFQSDQEAQNILGKIIDAYNNLIAPEHDRLDNSTVEARAVWFNSVDIDFSTPVSTTNSETYKSKINQISLEMVKYYDNVFPYLPPGAIKFLLLAGPALESYGYPFERFKKLMLGKKPTDIEKEILRWAYTITLYLLAGYIEKYESDKKQFLLDATLEANKELDENNTKLVISEIYINIEEHFAYLEKNKIKN
ncbi:MAG: hypothetical protein M1391_12435 [Bacteroidetes bacterium]|nr:hypothetical protein [Bacteroidota bacterium]